MRTEERAYNDEPEQRYLFARCMAPYAYLAECSPCTGRRILDAGCGTGTGSAILAEAGARVHAVDRSREDIVATGRLCSRVRAVAADVCQLPFADRSFDVVVSSHVLEHLPEPGRYLWEIRRVLAPGGRLWLVTPNRRLSSPKGPPANPYHVKEYFVEELAELVGAAFPRARFLGVSHDRGGNVARAEKRLSTLHSLDVLGIRRILPGPLKRWMRRATGTAYPRELDQVVPGDFQIGPLDPLAAVDLVVIAETENPS